ncbi:MAG TPA: fumarylacetoacetate hydrolase family protein [Ignavibacteriaceae bacterium]|nr:fumarylacetoacetate hydrolase family protein [Ignavibacteriaceae bacterium]
MKLVSFLKNNEERLGLFNENKIFDLELSGKELNLALPSKMTDLLNDFENMKSKAKDVDNAIKNGKISKNLEKDKIKMLAPVPHPTSCRDGYAFRQHVATARRNRGVDMIPEFDQFPIFYLTNHNAIFGEGEIVVEKDHLEKLDIELEAAIVIGKKGKNIDVKDADSHIAGYMIMNDLSARVLQMEEMKLNLGPAKGKDFATVIGPWLVTTDELEKYKVETEAGNKYDLRMTAQHNGKQISDGNMKDMDWTFAQIIERASYGVELLPGDVIGSGTVGTGCYLELNGTWALEAKAQGKEFSPIWLKDGDTVELEITGLGKLSNKIVKANQDYSILEKKKNIK